MAAIVAPAGDCSMAMTRDCFEPGSAFLLSLGSIVLGGPATTMLIRNGSLGKALAATLGEKPVALLRGHGDVVVGPNVQSAVRRAIYTEVNARLQAIAIGIGGPINYISEEEGAARDKMAGGEAEARAWELWKRKAMGK
jgi:ribulose-5-phosphate 4-epimerase/fuculose-1-phosphate aldolase